MASSSAPAASSSQHTTSRAPLTSMATMSSSRTPFTLTITVCMTHSYYGVCDILRRLPCVCVTYLFTRRCNLQCVRQLRGVHQRGRSGGALRFPPGTPRWNARVDGPINCTGDIKHCRATALSSNGGLTWSTMQSTNIPDPMCKGSLVRWPGAKALVLSNAFSTVCRNVSVSLSRNNGISFDSHAVVFAGPSGYSALVISAEGIATVLFERGGKHPGKPGFGNYELCMVSAGILDLKQMM